VSVSKWRQIKLGDVIEINKNSYSAHDDWDYINYLDTGNITENRIDNIQYLDTRSDKIPSRAKRKVNANEIIYSTVRPNQKHYGIIKKPFANMLVSTGFAVINGKDGLADNGFLYWYLTQEHIVELLHTIGENSTSAYPSIKPSDIEGLDISLPTLAEQRTIAATLSALDDMIELNNKINKTLEEMAQAIFKSWFVDFEPFKDGEFENSELGLIPKGWRVGKLSDVGEIIGGGTPSKSKPEYYSEIGIPWITPKDLSINKNKYISRGEIDISELGLRESSARLMPKGTVLFSSRAPIGYIAIAKNAVTTNQGFKSVVPFENISSEYIYLLLKNSINEIESRATGSTFKEISGGEMKKVPIILPPKEIIRKFNEIATTLGKTQASLEDENNILMSIRDTLLPKLMSGEIRVPVEEVV
jgi:type I restriction enzyme S subunit